ncbi:MAG: type III secretion system chaperone [Verrucomicrobium sp.]
MKLDDLIKQLGASIGLPNLGLTDGSCRLVFDGNLPVDVEEAEEESQAHLLSNLGPLPQEEGEESRYYRRLLEANHFGRETGGMTLALVPSEGQFFLCGIISLGTVSLESFSKMLARFAREAHHWIVELESMSRDTPKSAPDADTPDLAGFIRV